MSDNIAFILGGGPRIGHSVAKAFLNEGYKVALGRRDTKASEDLAELDGLILVSVDVAKPDTVRDAFEEVTSKFGAPPNVVIYNAAALTMPDEGDPFSVTPADFERDSAINMNGGYTVLHHTTRGFKQLGDKEPKVFIATGNVTPFNLHPMATTLAAGKSGLIQLIRVGNEEYKKHGYRFYWVSQVQEDGDPVTYGDVNGDAHGEIYVDVTKAKTAEKWDVRFVAKENGDITYQD